MKTHKKWIAIVLSMAMAASAALPAAAADGSSAPSSMPPASAASSSAPASGSAPSPSSTGSSASETPSGSSSSSSEPSFSSSQPEEPAEPPEAKPYIQSDTTVNFTVTQGLTYAFRFEVVGPRGLEPHIAAGDGSVLRTENVRKTEENGHDVYYFQVRATGNPGQSSGIYTQLPGQDSVKHCTITVGKPYIKSDTTINFTVTQGKTYGFRFEVMGPKGMNPNIVAGNGNVLQTEKVRKVVENDHDVYYFTVRATGKPGESSSIYTQLPGQDGVKHCAIKVGKPYIKSDTTVDFNVVQGLTYGFRFEVVGPQGLEPSIVAGNGKVLQTENVRKVTENGNDVYYFTVRATGKPGEASSIYTQLPGQDGMKHCAIKVKAPYVISDTTKSFSLIQGTSYTFKFERIGAESLPAPTVKTDAPFSVKTEDRMENGHRNTYATVTAIGPVNTVGTVFTQLSGQEPVPCCSITVTKPYIVSDTTGNLNLPYGEKYTFRFDAYASKDIVPEFQSSNSNVKIQNVSKSTNGRYNSYFVTVRSAGEPGSTSDIYTRLPGQEKEKHCSVHVTASKGSLTCDTGNFELAKGKEYMYRFTTRGTNAEPKIEISDSNVLQYVSMRKDNRNNTISYYYKVKAVGNVGEKAIVKAYLPGQNPISSTVTITKVEMPPVPDIPGVSSMGESWKQEVLKGINNVRAEQGKASITSLDPELSATAQKWAEKLAYEKAMYHDDNRDGCSESIVGAYSSGVTAGERAAIHGGSGVTEASIIGIGSAKYNGYEVTVVRGRY